MPQLSDDRGPSTPRCVQIWTGVLVISAFGPYVVGGIRTEQIANYGSLALVLLLGWPWRRTFPVRALPLVLLWTGYLSIAVIGALDPPVNDTGFQSGSTFAGVDNLLSPLALMLVVTTFSTLGVTRDLLRTVARVIVSAMVINAVIAGVSVVKGSSDWLPLLSHFQASEGTGTVASLAEQNFRYTGLFNQPAEAGVAYSLAVFLLWYLSSISRLPRTTVVLAVGAVLTIGGALTVSKIFLGIGLPVALIVILRDRPRGARTLVGVVIAAALARWFTTTGVLPTWRGWSTIQVLLSTRHGSYLSDFSGNRFGGQGSLRPIVRAVMHYSPVFGFGAGGLQAPYDVGLVEALVISGVVGVALLLGVYVVLVRLAVTGRRRLQSAESTLGMATVVLALGGSLGLPALTGNRESTLLWIVLGLTVISAPGPAGPAGTPLTANPQLAARRSPLLPSAT